MIVKSNWSIEDKLLFFVGIFFFVLIAKEAYTIPITHDEASTIEFSKQSIDDIIAYTDPIPNNHIINTLLLKLNMSIFGDHPMTNRLPNVLSFLLYFYFIVKLGKLLFKESWIRIAFVLMLTCQPYLLDFFSLTRGYCLSVTLEMISLYYLYLYAKNSAYKDLIATTLAAMAGVYANFTLLNYFMPLMGILGILILINKKEVLKSFATLLALCVVLAAISYLPITRMMATDQFVFWGSTSFLKETMYGLAFGMRSGVNYFGLSNEVIIPTFLVAIAIMIGLGLIWIKKSDNKKNFLIAISMLFLVILYNNLQFYLLDVPFLNARTSLFLIPIVGLCMVFALDAIYQKFKAVGLILALVVSGFSVQHFIRGFNVQATMEWYYDQDTYAVLRDLDEIITSENLPLPVKVNCHWIFHPSLSYHIKQKYQDKITLVPYHKEIEPDTDALFYYTQSDELGQLEPRFNEIKTYGWGSRKLLRRK